MNDSTKLVQLSPAWFEARKGMITGSRVAGILGHSPFTTRKKVMDDLLREHHGLESKFTGNVATEWGNDHEDTAMLEYQGEFDMIVNTTGFHKHPDIDYIGVSPDGLVFNKGLERIVEIKCPYSQKIPSTVPDHYNDQCQLMMLTLDCSYTDLYYWTPDETKVMSVDYDPEWAVATMPILDAFYQEYLKLRDEEYIEFVEVDDEEALDLSGDLYKVRQEIKELKDLEALLVEKLKTFVDDKSDTVIGRYKAIHASRKGAINASKMGKAGIDVDAYRNKETTYITFKEIKE